jgi:predicted metal-dependent phosphoesterase TrpH
LKSQGYSAVVVSDHQIAESGLEAKRLADNTYSPEEMVVIPGQEYTCCRIHMNFYNINETISIPGPYPSDDDLRNAIDTVHQQGGLVIVNHIPWSLYPEGGQFGSSRIPGHPSREQLRDWGVDGFEVISENIFDYPTYKFCLDNNLVAVSGSDTHAPVGTFGWTVVTLEDGAKRTPENIIKALKNRQTQLIYKPEGLIPVSVNDKVDEYPLWIQFLTPVLQIGDIFSRSLHVNKGMYSFVDGEFCHQTRVESKPMILVSMLLWVVILYAGWKLFNSLGFYVADKTLGSLYSQYSSIKRLE